MRIYELGARVFDKSGELVGLMPQLTFNAETNTVSHAVVYSPDDGRARLVPISMTRPALRGIHLSCDSDEYERLPSPVAVHLIDPSTGRAIPDAELGEWPLASIPSSAEKASAEYPIKADEVLPTGTVPIRQKEPVQASDGEAGYVHSLIVAESGYTVTHVVMEERHMWHRKQTAIPTDAIAEVTRESVRLRWTRATLKSLPAFEPEGRRNPAADHPDGG